MNQKQQNYMRTIQKLTFQLVAAAGILGMSACSKLDPKLGEPNQIAPTTTGGAPTPPSLAAVYEQLNNMSGNQGNWFAMQEHTTDIIMGPTRGTDWDDLGTWRRLHLHTWDGDHNQVRDTWNGLNGALFQTTLIAETATGATKAQGQFLRAFFRFITCDLYGQVQTRPATAPAKEIPAVLTRTEAIDAIIKELEECAPNLPVYNITNRRQATREAAWALLAKCYLNRAVYKQDPTKPAGPYTFQKADMDKVIQYANQVAANPLLQVDTYYWDNFTWDNGAKSSENIFVRHNGGDAVAGNGTGLRWTWSMSNHYNQVPDGWNGFVALSQFYDSFEGTDVRLRDSIATNNYSRRVGATAGMLVGQVYAPLPPAGSGRTGQIGDPVGAVRDRSGNPLVFSRRASLTFNNEATGIRFNKYPMNPASLNDGAWGTENEFPFLRFSDVRLMKAEAILRGGTDAETPLAIVNGIRARRRVANLTSITLPVLLAERGRELYLEGHRRTDLIRFGQFNAPVEERPSASSEGKVVFPIPTVSLSSNPNLKQNFGY